MLVLDKSEFPRDKVCAGWITPQVVEELELDLARLSRAGACSSRSRGFVTGHRRARERTPVRYDKVVSYGIRRCEFDHYLLRAAARACASAKPGSRMERDGDRWLVNGEISAPLVIGAGGHFCPVARFLGAQLGKDERAICAQEIEFEMTDDAGRRLRVEPDRRSSISATT